MLWFKKSFDVADFFTHRKWKKKPPLSFAEHADLPEIILHSKSFCERKEAIGLLRDDKVRAELACRVREPESIWYLILGIRDQYILYSLAADPAHSELVRLYAIEWIHEPETLRLIAGTESEVVRTKAYTRLVDIADSTERLQRLANDDELPLYHRMMAALRLGNGPAILALHGTAIYRDSDIVRLVIDKALQGRKEEA